LGVGTAGSGTTGEIRATNNITAFYSDKRLKDIISTIPNALDKLLTLSGVIFTQNKKAEEFGYTDYSEQVGVIAQEVQAVLPQVVKPAPFDLDENNQSKSGENYITVQYEKLVPLLIEAIKEQQKQIDELKAKIGN
jgi:trimeric autotransporter adhesin